MIKKYEDVPEETLTEEDEQEKLYQQDITISYRDNKAIEKDGFITVHPPLNLEVEDDNDT